MIQTLKHKLKTIYSNKLTLYTAPLFVFLLFFIATPSVYAESTTGKLALKVADIIFGNMAKGIASFIEYIAKFIMFLGSQFLDLTISFSLNTGNLKMAAITDTWTIARDVTNMLFIFILLYVGIMLILRMSNFQTKKILTNLIIVGLLLNFSYFLTGAVIDAGNISGGLIYRAMTPVVSMPDGTLVQKKVGGILMDNMDVALLNQKKRQETTDGKLDNFKLALTHISNAILFVVAGFAFFAGGFIFLIRQVVLTFVIILSPLAFAAIILPKTAKHWEKWLDYLIGSTFIAPIYLLLVSFVVMISGSSGFTNATRNETLDYAVSADVSKFGAELLSTSDMILQYVLIVGMLIGSVVIAKNVSGSVGGMAVSMSGKVMGAGAGAGAAVGRRTIGRGARAFGQSGFLRRGEERGGIVGGLAAYGSRKSMQVGNASMDVRGGKTGAALKNIKGVKFGDAKSGGYGAVRDAQVNKRIEIADNIGKGTASRKERKDLNEAHKKRRAAIKSGDIVEVSKQDDKIKKHHDLVSGRAKIAKLKYEDELMTRTPFSTAAAQTAANREAAKDIRAGKGKRAKKKKKKKKK